jgi:dCMP deaminase
MSEHGQAETTENQDMCGNWICRCGAIFESAAELNTHIGSQQFPMKRTPEFWDRWFLGLAQYISTASKDPSTQVGAILVKDKIVVGMGYNGFARGVDDTPERLNNRELKYQLIVHAEVNAIIQAGDKAQGSTLYVYPSFMIPPICADCCKAVIQAGVVAIVGFYPDETDPRAQRWKNSIQISKDMWLETGRVWRTYPE